MSATETDRKENQMRYKTAVALAILIAISTMASAQKESPLRTISVSGTVETKIAPDQIVWRISLTDTDRDMRRAKKKNDAKIESVISIREKLGVAYEDISTGTLNIRKEYERVQGGGRGPFKHFVVRRSVTIRQRDLKRFDEFLDTLVSSAEMEVGFSFESSDIHQVRAETRLKALQVAKKKAEAMTRVVGSSLGKILTINESSEGGAWKGAFSNNIEIQSTPSVDLASEKFIPGAISVQMTVYATFEIV